MIDLDTIREHDGLTRTLNEIHKCVLPRQPEFRVVKSREEVEASFNHLDDASVQDNKDPRRNKTRLLAPSFELINDYGYSSELTVSEHQIIINSLNIRINHNPSLVNRNSGHIFNNISTSAQTVEKHKKEIALFNKCAEIFFYRNIGDLNSLVTDDVKLYLIDRWHKLEYDDDDRKFQVITMLLRDQVYAEGTEVEFLQTTRDDFSHDSYVISDTDFPPLHQLSVNDLKFYDNIKTTESSDINSNNGCDVALSLDFLAKLFTDSEQFSVQFDNRETLDGKLLSIFHNVLPSKPVSISQALEEVVQNAIRMSFDWSNMNKLVKPTNIEQLSFRSELVSDKMKKIFLKFKKNAGSNQLENLWMLNHKSERFKLKVTQPSAYFSKINGELIPTNISVKLEYQTKYGAEKMTREELIKEWCALKFNLRSTTFRFRIDAMTFKILSITRVSPEEIEHELKEHHGFSSDKSMGCVINLLNCIKRLPECNYLILTKIEDSCKKLYIYKSAANGRSLSEGPWEVSSEFTRRWIPIDEFTPTFLHENHNFPPCCFLLHADSSDKAKLTFSARDKSPQSFKKKKKIPLNKKFAVRKPFETIIGKKAKST